MRSKLVLAATCALPLGAGLWGCQSILGIEELSDAPRPRGEDTLSPLGGAGDGGSGGSGSSQGGSASPGGGGGMAQGGGGAAGLEPVSDAGTDAAPAGAITVAGRVIDFYRNPAPGLRVTIGQAEVLTGDDGEFTIAGVSPPYDVSLIASSTPSDFAFRYYAYVYQGLTRPDPTLQVYYGLPGRGSSLSLTVTNAPFVDPNQRLIFAFSSPHGHYSASGINGPTASLSPSWVGPDLTAGNAHGLLVLRASPATGAPPVAYEAYETTPLELLDNVDSNLSFNMSADTIPQVNLTGSVDPGQLGSPTLIISTRFADGTVLPLLTEESNQATFSYLVPSLAGASLVVAASAGAPGYVVAHADGVPPAAAQNVALSLPRPVAPSAPGNGSEVVPGTLFSWSTVGQTAQVFVWHLESAGFFQGIYVITSRSEIEYPSVPGYSMNLPTPGDDFVFDWSVETHGDYPSVDAAAGPDGLYDSFALELNVGTGPARGSRGYYTLSDSRVVNVVAQ